MNAAFFERIYYNNTVGDYLFAAAVILAGALLLRILQLVSNKIFSIQERRLKESGNSNDTNRFKSWSGMQLAGISRLRIDTRRRLLHQVIFPLVFMAFFAYGLFSLEFTPQITVIIRRVYFALLFCITLRAAIEGIEISFLRFSRKESRIEQARSIKPLISMIKLILWILGAIFLLGNLGFDVSTALAGLGISGIAIAIAAQGILGDLFGYFVILFDKPFSLGDLVTVDGVFGWVEKIGIKTTHLRTLQGELLVIANTNVSSCNLHNFAKMQHRRVVLTIGVTYSTPSKEVEAIPELIRGIVDATTIIEGVICDRSHFKGFGDFSLDFETVYYVPVNDYRAYMDVQENINLRLLKAFEDRGIEFAFPTQTLHIQN